MPSRSATRRASPASSTVQHPRALSRRVAGFLASARWTPTTSCPASSIRAAATAESTPPLIAATPLLSSAPLPGLGVGPPVSRRPAERTRLPRAGGRSRMVHDAGQLGQEALDVAGCGGVPEGDPQTGTGRGFTESEGEDDMARPLDPGLARRARRDADAHLVEPEDQRLAVASVDREVGV